MIQYVTTTKEYADKYHRETIAIIISQGVRIKEEIEDISQQLYLRLQKALDDYDPKISKFTTYITCIIRNLIASYKTSYKGISVVLDEELYPAYDDLELQQRIDDFKYYCERTGSHGLKRILSELNNRLGYTGAYAGSLSKHTWYSYRDSFLKAEQEG